LVRRKKNRKIVWKRRLTLLAVLAVVILGCIKGPGLFRSLHAWWGREVRFPLKAACVENNRWISDEAVLKRISVPIGESLFSLKLEKIRNDVECDPWIEKAHVYRRFPSTVVIYIEEVKPLLLVAGNPMGIIGANGVYLGKTWPGKTWDFPIIAEVGAHRLVVGQPVKSEEVMALINCAFEVSTKAPDVYEMISDLYLKKSQIIMNLADGHSTVRVARDPFSVNWDVLKEFMLKNREDFAEENVEIDMRFPQWVIVSPVKG
jgi:cell division septal protein FtsQ